MGKRQEVSRAADTVGDHPILQTGARVGYAISGVLHLLIGWIALQIAWSASRQSADESGALEALAGNALGQLTLWVAVLGFLALGLWDLANAVAVRPGPGSSPWAERGKGVSKAIVHFALAWTCYSTLQGRPHSNTEQSSDFTATLLQQTGGRLLVVLVGLVVIGVGVYHVRKGWKKDFLQDLDEHPGTLATRAGVAGYVAKGIALVMVGALFVAAAMQNSSAKATGLDGALRALHQQPYGPWLLTAVAVGIAAYGFYSFARARHADV
jgi:Domain of Unknown Function (DUF1206)